MTQHDFIYQKLLPLLTFHSKMLIAEYVSSNFQITQCIETLTEYKVDLQVELNNLEAAINLLKTIKQ